MKTLTAYRVSASIIEEKIYSKIFYIDETIYTDQDEIEEAIFDIASEAWINQDSAWEIDCCHTIDGVDIYEIVKA